MKRIIIWLPMLFLFTFCAEEPTDNNCGATDFSYTYNDTLSQVIINWVAVDAASFTASATINGSQTASGNGPNTFATLNGMFPGDSIELTVTATCNNGLTSDEETFEIVIP